MSKKFEANMSKNGRVDVHDVPVKSSVPEHANRESKTYTPQGIFSEIAKRSIKIQLSWNTILTVLAIIIGVKFWAQLLQILVILFFAFVFASSVIPMVKGLVKRGFSKGLSIFVVYAGMLSILAGLVLLVTVPLVREIKKLPDTLPKIIEKNLDSSKLESIPFINLDQKKIDSTVNDLSENLSNDGLSFLTSGLGSFSNTIKSIAGVADNFFAIFSSLLISIYIVADHDSFFDVLLLRIVEGRKRKRVKRLISDVENKLGRWLLGQGLLCFIIGFLTWIVLTIAGVPFALPLAVLAGLLEAIPSIGPLMTILITVPIAFISRGAVPTIIVAIGAIAIQQMENSVIVPRVMGNVVGLKPVAVVVGVIVGFVLSGPIGALLSVPAIVLIKIGYEFYIDLQKLKAEGIV